MNFEASKKHVGPRPWLIDNVGLSPVDSLWQRRRLYLFVFVFVSIVMVSP